MTAGPYRFMRHPATVGFVMMCAGYLLLWWDARNAMVLGAAVALAVVAAFWEEGVLRRSDEYQEYATRVRWRFLPGLF